MQAVLLQGVKPRRSFGHVGNHQGDGIDSDVKEVKVFTEGRHFGLLR